MTLIDDLTRLESEFADAMQRMYLVGNDLQQVRLRVEATERTAAGPPAPVRRGPSASVAPASVAPASQAPVPRTAPVPRAAAPDRGVDAPPELSPAGPSRRPWWQRGNLVAMLLGVAGAGVMLLGVTLLVVIAIQAGVFGPVPRVLSGAVLAAGLGAVGVWLHRRSPGNVGATALMGTGLAAAYLDLAAVTVLYGWVPPVVGVVAAGLVAAIGAAVARAWDSQFLASLSWGGAGLLAPVVTGLDSWVGPAFLLALVAGSAAAHAQQAWPWLRLARWVPAILVHLAAVIRATEQGSGAVAVVLLTSVLATLGVLETLGRTRRREDWASLLVVPTSGIPLLLGAGLLDGTPRIALRATVALAYLGIAALMAGRRTPLAVHAGLLVLATAHLVAASADALSAPLRLGAVAALAAAYLLAAGLDRTRVLGVLGTALAVLTGLSWLEIGITLLGAGTATRTGWEQVAASALVALALLALAVAHRCGTAPRPELGLPAGTLASVGALVPASGVVVLLGVRAGAAVDDPAGGFVAGHALVTLAWLALAVALLVLGPRRLAPASLPLVAGLALAALAVGKLVLFDLASLSGLWRVLAFVGGGALLLVMATTYAASQHDATTGVK